MTALALPFPLAIGPGGGGVAPGGGKLELIEAQQLAADAAAFTFSGLDGDADQIYVVMGALVESGGVYLDCRMNGDTGASYDYRYVQETTAQSYQGGTGQNQIRIADLAGQTTLFAVVSATRYGVNRARGIVGMNSRGSVIGHGGGQWNNTADNLTSLTFYNSDGSDLLAGSQMTLYRVARA